MIRMSYSLLDRWLRGDKTGAIAMYLRTPIKKTPAMEEGIAFDRKVKDSIIQSHALPEELGGLKLADDTIGGLTISKEFPTFSLKGEFDGYSKKDATIYE